MWHMLIEKAKSELVRYAGWMLLGQAIISFSALIVTYTLANFVSKDVAGSYRFVTSTYLVAASFAFAGIGVTLTKAVAQGKTGSISRLYKLKFILGCLAAVFLLGFGAYTYLHTHDSAVLIALVVAAFVLPLTEMFSLYNSSLQGASLFKLSSLYLGGGRLFVNIIVAITAIKFPSLLPIAVAYFLGTLVYAFVADRWTSRLISREGESDPNAVTYAAHISFSGVISGVVSQLNTFVLYGFFGPAALAGFWIASIVPQEIGRVGSIVSPVIFPRLAQVNREEAFNYVRKWWWIVSVGVVCAMVAYLFVAPIIFHVFFKAYLDQIQISVFLLFGFAFVPYSLVWQLITARGHVRGIYIINIAEPILLIVMYVIWVPLFGVKGVVYATVADSIIENIIAFMFMYQNRWLVRLLER